MTHPSAAWKHLPGGSKATFSVPVAVRPDGSSVELPALFVRGAARGKTLLVTAGVHGDEFEGMAALHALYGQLDPGALAGTFVAVPLANPPAYEAALRTNPDDRQDMARVFPGNPAGTVTEQLAFALTHRFIRHADFFCDLHSAGQYYAMPPVTGYQLRPEPLLTAQRQAAQAFGLSIVWGTTALPGRSLSAAGDHGVPGIYAEITGEGRCRAKDVTRYVEGLRRLLSHLGLTREIFSPRPVDHLIEDDRPEAGYLQGQNRAPVGGFFRAEVAAGQGVQKDQQVGVILDPFGHVRHTIRAPHTGLVVFLRTYPRVLAGDPLCTVLELKN